MLAWLCWPPPKRRSAWRRGLCGLMALLERGGACGAPAAAGEAGPAAAEEEVAGAAEEGGSLRRHAAAVAGKDQWQ